MPSSIPSGYYDDAEELTGEELREALHEIIDDHNSQSYGSLWSHYNFTDKKENGKVWDMYSTPAEGEPSYEYTFGDDQCGNYSAEGSCYNREHSVPASWYNDANPTYTDLFQVYPTDGWTNGLRSNLPYGEVDNPSSTTTNGSKKGANTYPGYTGLVFEPIDEYKGDFARTYFYMVTRYMDDVSGWNSAAFEEDNLSEWHRNMMLEWHWNDPVSTKEIERNNTVYLVQENRNPFIDHPEWVDLIWESTSNVTNPEAEESISLTLSGFKVQPSGNWSEIKIYNSLGELIQAELNVSNSEAILLDDKGLIVIHLVGRDVESSKVYKFIL